MKKINLLLLAICTLTLPVCVNAQVKKEVKSAPAASITPQPLNKAEKNNPGKKAAGKKGEEQPPAISNMDEMMKNWQSFMTPGEEHRMMETWNGEWVGHVSMWMAPGTEPSSSESFCTNTMTMGGRYQKSAFKGDFSGMPFEGEGTTAYDNIRKIFISSWIDNMGTSIMYMEGTWDAKTKTINFKGTNTDPMSGSVSSVRETYQIIDENTHLMTMYGPDMTGKEFKTMEMKLKKK